MKLGVFLLSGSLKSLQNIFNQTVESFAKMVSGSLLIQYLENERYLC